jgi:energy-coupling factor transporter transmembrane protein EcfT
MKVALVRVPQSLLSIRTTVRVAPAHRASGPRTSDEQVVRRWPSGAVPLFVQVLREDLRSALQARGVTARVEQTRGARLWEVEVFPIRQQSNPGTKHLDYSQEAGSH